MFSHILASGKVISKAVLLWESSKFLVVIICHMTRFSEIWSACFRLGAHHQPPTTDGGNSFKCQKVPRKRTLPVWSGHLHLRISVLSCKIALAKYWSNNSCFLFLSRTNISLLIDDQLSTSLLFSLARRCSNQEIPPYVPLHPFHLLQTLPLLLLLLRAFASQIGFFKLESLFSSACWAFFPFQPAVAIPALQWWEAGGCPATRAPPLFLGQHWHPGLQHCHHQQHGPSSTQIVVKSHWSRLHNTSFFQPTMISVRRIWFRWRPCKAETAAELQVADCGRPCLLTMP